MNAPVFTTTIAQKTAVSDELLVNRDGSTALQSTSDLATQIAGEGAVANALQAVRADVSASIADMSNKLEAAAEGYVSAAAWAQLVATPGTRAGQPGRVSPTDTGTHTDPVVGGTVPNRGEYSWSVSPAGWRRTGDVLDTKAILYQSALTSGEQLNSASNLGTTANGASLVTVGGRPVGISIPSGQTGTGSSVTTRMRLDPGEAKRSIGKFYRIRTAMTATDGYLTAKPFAQTNVIRIDNVDGSVTFGGTVEREVQVGTTIYRDLLYGPVTGAEDRIGALHQVTATSFAAHNFQIVSVSREIAEDTATTAMTALDATLANRLATYATGWGRIYSVIVPQNQNLNGALQRLSADGRAMGYTIPVGSSGVSSNVRYRLQIPGDLRPLLQTRRVRFLLVFATSTSWARAFSFGVTTLPASGGTRTEGLFGLRNEQVQPTRREIEFEVELDGDELEIQLTIQLTGTGAASAEESLLLTDMEVATSLLNQSAGYRSIAAENLAAMWEFLKASASSLAITAVTTPGYQAGFGVAASGGDFTSIAGALAAANDAAAYKRYALRVKDGTYLERSLAQADYQDIVGAGIDRTVIDGSQADSAALADITNRSTFDLRKQASLQGVTAIMRNGRYVVHADGSNGAAFRSRTQRIADATLIHQGNQGAIDHQTSTGGNPSGVWASPHAVGHGSSSGSELIVERSRLVAPRCALQFHTNLDFDAPSKVIAHDSELIATNNQGWACLVQPNGSGRQDSFVLEGCSGTGDIYYWPDPWMPTTLDRQCADHCEINVSGYGNRLSGVFINAEFGRALKIESASTSGSSTVAVSGSAVSALFGKQVYSKPGSGGIKGYVYGWADIQESVGVGIGRNLFITSLGKRLGDCTASPLTLAITVDGSAPVSIVFNADYSAASNASVLAIINAALGAAATASEYNVGGRYRPRFADEEQTFSNIGVVGILMGMAVAYDGSRRSVRPMTSADALSLFAGVAWEDIYPGGWGRVKTTGWLPKNDLLRTGAAPLNLNDAFTIDPARPGYVVSTAQPSSGILPVVRPSLGAGLEAVRVGLV